MIYDFICFVLFLLLQMYLKTPVLLNHTMVQGSIPYQQGFSVQVGEIIFDVSL